MKFNCGPTAERKAEELQQWHRIFAILPHRVGPNDCRWLEFIERRYPDAYVNSLDGAVYRCGVEYRAIREAA